MNRFKFAITQCGLLAISGILMAGQASAMLTNFKQDEVEQTRGKGIAVAFPWNFRNGKATARLTAVTTVEEIARRGGYSSVPTEVAETAWANAKLRQPSFGRLPTASALRTFGKKVKADRVLFGSVSWHTRSIWVNAGPKTISTATVNAYVFDVKTSKVVYKRTGVTGRSDEKSNGLKVAAAVLFSPLVTAVSGGPATPQEQRAAQIALSLAYRSWVGN